MFELEHYLNASGQDLFTHWLKALKDPIGKRAIIRRLSRLTLGHFGDHKPCAEGVWELRIDTGPGYRVYYARAGQTLILLLCGGSKRTQQSDIERACEYWKDWQNREPNGER